MIVTMEDHVLMGGFGSAVLEALNEGGLSTPVERIGWPDNFVGHGSSAAELRAQNGISPEEIEEKVLSRWKAAAKTNRVQTEAAR